MFEGLQDRLEGIIHKVKGYGKITEENISEMLREVRLALLEADVNYKVVKEFTTRVKEKALGEEVATSLKPGEVFVKITPVKSNFSLNPVITLIASCPIIESITKSISCGFTFSLILLSSSIKFSSI